MTRSTISFGVCCGVDQIALVRQAGFGFVEPGVVSLLAPELSDEEWKLPVIESGSAPVANMMLPGDLAVVGDSVDQARIRRYVKVMCDRAARVGIRTIVFGAGRSRRVPDGFPRDRAFEQIVWFLGEAAAVAVERKVTIAIEPLNSMECNIINSIAEAATFMKAVDSPAVKLLFDTYHAWMDREPLSNLRAVANKVAHVHVADRDGRIAPGVSGLSDYRPVFRILREANYQGLISIEARNFSPTNFIRDDGPNAVLKFLTRQWNESI